MGSPQARRADELLTELVELVETARSVPISSSCVLPRERTLDLLDDLREALPPELSAARSVLAQRDQLLGAASDEAGAMVESATRAAEAERLAASTAASEQTAAAELHAVEVVSKARVEAARLVEAGELENARLISAAGVHQAATIAAEQLRLDAAAYVASARADADEYAGRTRRDADDYAYRTRADTDDYANSLRVNAEEYAERTLAEIVGILQRAAAVAERGRDELAARHELVDSAGAAGVPIEGPNDFASSVG